MGYVPQALAVTGQKLKVRILGKLWDAEVVEDSPYDPTNSAIRVDG
jgi:dimethylglycine dehydrogenase